MKKHWWSFVFSENKGYATTTASVYMGWEHGEWVNMPRINSAKEKVGVGQGAIMLSCSYLGYMTNEHMLYGEYDDCKTI